MSTLWTTGLDLVVCISQQAETRDIMPLWIFYLYSTKLLELEKSIIIANE